MKLVRWMMAAAVAAGVAFVVSSCDNSDSDLEAKMKKAGKEIKSEANKAGKEIESGMDKAGKKLESIGD